ncbi:hypothetical protein ACJ72_06973 [Emergomyces africanus]|uniref:Uncharacterized protein n=1 Tax=Emergomyces africanus TaxID=1955775 RepID=A0A1B7NPM7_9EURO|nr:hypothetical protein ACJ72_06973 [Emergomyces africanus]
MDCVPQATEHQLLHFSDGFETCLFSYEHHFVGIVLIHTIYQPFDSTNTTQVSRKPDFVQNNSEALFHGIQQQVSRRCEEWYVGAWDLQKGCKITRNDIRLRSLVVSDIGKDICFQMHNGLSQPPSGSYAALDYNINRGFCSLGRKLFLKGWSNWLSVNTLSSAGTADPPAVMWSDPLLSDRSRRQAKVQGKYLGR